MKRFIYEGFIILFVIKSENLDNLLQIARYFNNHPRDSVKNLLKFCQSYDILRSYDGIYRALRTMEQNKIFLNGCVLVKNHKSYKNIHYLIQTEDTNQFMDFIHQNKDSIEAVYRSRQGKENIMYVKATNLLDSKGSNVIEKTEWKSYTVIFPWKWDSTEKFLRNIPEDITPEESPPPEENLAANPGFRITEDVKTLLYWYKVNVRLPDVPIMKETGFDHRKVKTLREIIFANSLIYYPVFLHGAHHYVPLYFSFYTKCYDFFIKLLARNSGTSYLIRGKDGRTSLFVNTMRPNWVLRAMERFEDTGITRDMLFYSLQDRWDPLTEDFKLGKILEKYFWMFGVSRKRNKK